MKNIAFVALFLLYNSVYSQFDLNYIANGHEFEPGSTEYLFADNVKFRLAPDLNSEVHELLPIGTKITIVEKIEQKYTYAGLDSYWYKVEVNGKSGYLLGALISMATLTSDGTVFYTQIEKEENDNLSLHIRYKIPGNAYKETTIPLIAPYLSLNISNGKGLIGVNNILTIDSYSEPCDHAAVMYVFWNGQELNHIAELRYFNTPERFNRVKFIFPNDEGGINNKMVYYKESRKENELDWTPVHEEVEEFQWTGKELVPEGQSPKQSAHDVIAKKNIHDETKSDIYIKKQSTGKNDFFLTIANVYSDHYHFGEYHNGNVYVIRRIGYDGYPDDDWTDELWKYDQQKNGTKLFSGSGISFRVSPNEEFIAVTHDTYTPHARASILNKKGVILNTYTLKELGDRDWDESIDLFNWSDDSKLFWGGISYTDSREMFFCIRLDESNCGIEIFHSEEIPDSIEDEFEIETNTGQLVYSTYPLLFMGTHEEVAKENPTIYLKVYDFYTKQIKEIDSSKFKKFIPKWIGTNLLEYTEPKTQKRIRKKLSPILN